MGEVQEKLERLDRFAQALYRGDKVDGGRLTWAEAYERARQVLAALDKSVDNS